MNTITIALARKAQGWNPADEIRDRAALMRGHAEAGNLERAEEYALEIERLQADKPTEMPCWATCTRKLGYVAWSNVLIHGYLRGRTFWMDCDDNERAAGRANFLYTTGPFTAADIL